MSEPTGTAEGATRISGDDEEEETSDFSVSKASRSDPDQPAANSSPGTREEEEEGSGEQRLHHQGTGGHSEDTCYSSSVLNSEEASVVSLPVNQSNGAVPTGGHYEECTVSSTVTISRMPTSAFTTVSEKSEIFITMAAVPLAAAAVREPSELERNLAAAGRLLTDPLRLASPEELEDALAEASGHLLRLEDAFVPASLSEEQAAPLLSELVEVKGRLRARQAEAKELLERLAQCAEEMSGLGLWMKEVKAFLGAEEAAYGELETLEAQLRESNALQVRFLFVCVCQ